MIYIEYNKIITQSGTCSSSERVYYGQCGWTGYDYNDVTRQYFVFNDGNGFIKETYYIHANHPQIQQATTTTSDMNYWKYAGLLCIMGPGKFFFETTTCCVKIGKTTDFNIKNT